MNTGRGKRVFLLLALWVACPWAWLHAQAADEEPIGFDEIKVGAHIFGLPIPCLRPVVCEDRYESMWVRVWHANAQVRRVDVVYAGWESKSGGEIRSSPITLAQAIRTHSLRYGSKTPRLGFAGNEGPYRMVVDFANGISYLAGAVTETSPVVEVRYLSDGNPLIERAFAEPLFQRGTWLVRAALLSPRYKNLVAETEGAAAKRAADAQAMLRNEPDTNFLSWNWK